MVPEGSDPFEPYGPFGGAGVYFVSALRDDDFALGNQTTSGGAGGFHEFSPLFAFPCDLPGGLRGADGGSLGGVREQGEDGGFKLKVSGAFFGNSNAAAFVTTIFHAFPGTLPLFSPCDDATTDDAVFGWQGAIHGGEGEIS